MSRASTKDAYALGFEDDRNTLQTRVLLQPRSSPCALYGAAVALLFRNMQLLPLLSDTECEAIVGKVLDLRFAWLHRMPPFGVYTLGLACYADAHTKLYEKGFGISNEILLGQFPALFKSLRERMEEELRAPVRYHEQAAVPGFHVFLEEGGLGAPVPPVHKDLQFEHVNWSGLGAPDLEHPISFTLALELPKNGGGLNHWTRDPNLLPPPPVTKRDELTRGLVKSYVPYARGHMVLHSGLEVHQISPLDELCSGDRRITLQGHGLRCGDTWWLYW